MSCNFSNKEMSKIEIEQQISKEYSKQKKLIKANRWFYLAIQSSDWHKDFLHAITNLTINANSVNADKYILKWWEFCDELTYTLKLMSQLPPLMKRISEGVLRDEIKVSETQAQEFLKSISNRTYDPQQFGFIPTVEDWNVFLKKWNAEVFENLDEDYLESYGRYYPEVLESKQCLKKGATEAEILELEKKLQAKLPLGYRNFLLSSNGFILLNYYLELYGTDQINWLIELDRNLAEGYDENEEDISDEEYFQYGEHQNCGLYREKYLKTALQISSTEDCFIYLLNPVIVDNRNEWEAWDVGSKYPGAYRYRSFWDMMQATYKRTFADY